MALPVCSPVVPRLVARAKHVHVRDLRSLHDFIVVGDRLHRESFRLVARREPHGLGFSLLCLTIPGEPGIGSGTAATDLCTRRIEGNPLGEDPNPIGWSFREEGSVALCSFKEG